MTGRKPADKLRPDQSRQAVWDVIRKLKTVTIDRILYEVCLSRAAVSDYIIGLVAAGFLHKHDEQQRPPLVHVKYSLIKDNGQEAPRVRKDGTIVTQGLAREQMWRAMGIFSQKGKTFTIRDLTLFATTVTTPVAEIDAKHYCKHLQQIGYLTTVKAGSAGKLTIYRMPPNKWTGPKPVQIQRTRRCFDPNTGATVHVDIISVEGGEYPAAKIVSAVSVYKHNFSSLATMIVRFYANTGLTTQIGSDYTASLGGVAVAFGLAFQPAGWGMGGAVYGGTTFDSWPASYFTIWMPAPVPAVMGFKIIISDPGAASYLEAGRIYMGDYWSPETNISYGMSMAWREQSRQFRTDGNSLRTEGYEPYRAFSIQLDWLKPAERTQIVNSIRKLGLRKDFLISVYPTAGGDLENDYTAAVKLTASPDVKAAFFNNFSTSEIQLEEV